MKTLNFRSIEFEPDGNVPPDYLLDDSIAVEVTRLNEHFEFEGVVKRYDDDSGRIFDIVRSSLESFLPPFKGRNYWVAIDVKQPFGKTKKTRNKIRDHLQSFTKPADIILGTKYQITDSLAFSYLKGTTNVDVPVYQLGWVSLFDSGGIVTEEMVVNSRHCIERKSRKIERYRNKYSEWWLVLVDTVSCGQYAEYIEYLRETIDRGAFDKIVFIEPIGGKYVFEI